MKVENTGPISSVSASKRKQKKDSAAGGSFSTLLGGEDSTVVKTSSVQQIGSLDALLLAQEVDDDFLQERQIKHGENLLRYLDEVRLGLLSGTVSASIAKQLAEAVQSSHELAKDPRLSDILNSIEVRAAVELAKMEQARRKTSR